MLLPAAVVSTFESVAPPIAVDDVAAGDIVGSTLVVAKQQSKARDKTFQYRLVIHEKLQHRLGGTFLAISYHCCCKQNFSNVL